jgi:hypothetical protein
MFDLQDVVCGTLARKPRKTVPDPPHVAEAPKAEMDHPNPIVALAGRSSPQLGGMGPLLLQGTTAFSRQPAYPLGPEAIIALIRQAQDLHPVTLVANTLEVAIHLLAALILQGAIATLHQDYRLRVSLTLERHRRHHPPTPPRAQSGRSAHMKEVTITIGDTKKASSRDRMALSHQLHNWATTRVLSPPAPPQPQLVVGSMLRLAPLVR